MPPYGLPNRPFRAEREKSAPINWRRGMFRIWILVSAAWIMAWAIALIIQGIGGEMKVPSDLLQIPVVLFGPPVALLLFGIAARWAFQGFRAEDDSFSSGDDAP